MLGVYVPNIVFGQPKNRISLQTGLMHCFFDGSPLINIRYPQMEVKPFNGVLINSVGLRFERKLKNNYTISADFMNFFEGYTKTFEEHKVNQVYDRLYNTATVNINRFLSINRTFNFVFGGGLNYRFGQENIIVNYGYFGGFGYESLAEVAKRSDFGINLLGGIEYSPIKYVTLFSKIDFLGFVYMTDKESREKLKSVYDMKNFPSPFDLSLKLGAGFNF